MPSPQSPHTQPTESRGSGQPGQRTQILGRQHQYLRLRFTLGASHQKGLNLELCHRILAASLTTLYGAQGGGTQRAQGVPGGGTEGGTGKGASGAVGGERGGGRAGAAEVGESVLTRLTFVAFESPPPPALAVAAPSTAIPSPAAPPPCLPTTCATAIVRCGRGDEEKLRCAAAACSLWGSAPCSVTVLASSPWLLPLCNPSLTP